MPAACNSKRRQVVNDLQVKEVQPANQKIAHQECFDKSPENGVELTRRRQNARGG